MNLLTTKPKAHFESLLFTMKRFSTNFCSWLQNRRERICNTQKMQQPKSAAAISLYKKYI